jgi:hypothetical protein
MGLCADVGLLFIAPHFSSPVILCAPLKPSPIAHTNTSPPDMFAIVCRRVGDIDRRKKANSLKKPGFRQTYVVEQVVNNFLTEPLVLCDPRAKLHISCDVLVLHRDQLLAVLIKALQHRLRDRVFIQFPAEGSAPLAECVTLWLGIEPRQELAPVNSSHYNKTSRPPWPEVHQKVITNCLRNHYDDADSTKKDGRPVAHDGLPVLAQLTSCDFWLHIHPRVNATIRRLIWPAANRSTI